ncbi:MAG: hypothetical protein QM791_20510 [Ferruginibacter sp.]
MKKLIALSAAALLFSATIFATDTNSVTISVRAKASFEKDFSLVSNVSWTKRNDLYFVSFDADNRTNEAAYNEQGELVAVSKTIAKDELPETVAQAISDKFGNYDVAKNATQITYDNLTTYYINVANSKHLLKLKCDIGGAITVEKRVKKEA